MVRPGLTAGLTILLAAACRSQTPMRVAAVPEPETHGVAAVHTLPRDVPPESSSGHVEVSAAFAQPENPLPEYPPEALRAKAGTAWVVVRIVVNESGTIREVRDSPVMRSSDGPYAAAFRSAVERALEKWQFEPAVRRVFEDGPDNDGDGKPDFQRMVGQLLIPMYFDLRFDFTIVEGRPEVHVR
jgi:TonB family protein